MSTRRFKSVGGQKRLIQNNRESVGVSKCITETDESDTPSPQLINSVLSRRGFWIS